MATNPFATAAISEITAQVVFLTTEEDDIADGAETFAASADSSFNRYIALFHPATCLTMATASGQSTVSRENDGSFDNCTVVKTGRTNIAVRLTIEGKPRDGSSGSADWTRPVWLFKMDNTSLLENEKPLLTIHGFKAPPKARGNVEYDASSNPRPQAVLLKAADYRGINEFTITGYGPVIVVGVYDTID